MAGWNALTGGVIGVGVGSAAGVALEPVLEPLKQDAWEKSQARLLDLGTLARLVASGLLSFDAAAGDASRLGFTAERFAAAVQAALVAAPVSEALTMRRRGEITADELHHAYAKAQLEPTYWPALDALLDDRLDPAVIAVLAQRGLVSSVGLLPVGAPTEAGAVPPMPMIDLDPFEEAAASGINADRLRGLTRIVGLPASPDLAARMVFRQIIERVDFDRAIAEGNTRNEWAPFLFDGFREILTAGQYAELQLRGFLTETARRAGTAKHGMSTADSDLLYDVLGRGIAVHAVTTGLARGGDYGGTYADVPEPYRSALERSNIRPEWAGLAYANRYSYPSAFVVRALLADGALTQAEGEQIFLDVGWKPDLAAKVAQHYAPVAAAAGDPHVTKAAASLWTTAHASYKAEEISAATARAALTTIGVAAGSQDQVLALWDAERALIRRRLSATQVRKALNGGVVNPATGVAWSMADALAAMLELGYSQEDAETFLAS